VVSTLGGGAVTTNGATVAVAAKLWLLHFEDHRNETASYRHFLANGVGLAQSVAVYHLNTEHAESDANFEIRQAAGQVDVFGVKSEGKFCVGWISDTKPTANVTVWGYGGNACPFKSSDGYPAGYSQFPPSLFRVTLAQEGFGNIAATARMGAKPGRLATRDEGIGRGRVRIANVNAFDMPSTLEATQGIYTASSP